MPRGAIIDGKLTEVLPVDLQDPAQIQEFVTTAGTSTPTRPRACIRSTASPSPTSCSARTPRARKTAIESIDESAKYSWVKSPRWRGHAMEVGPLARYVIGYATGNAEFKEPVDMVLKKLDVPLTALFSTLGRTAARGLECSWAAHKMRYFFDKLMANMKAGNFATANVDSWEPSTWPAQAQGVGLLRGAARRARPLDQDQGHEDRQLPVRRADDLERRPARRQEPDRRLRGGADEHADGQARRAARDPAHDPQLRSLPGLRHAT